MRYETFLREIPLFDELDTNELEVLERVLHPYQVKAGERIFSEGAHGNSVCFVLDGELAVLKKRPDGSEQEIALLGKGSSVGEMSAIDGLIRSASVEGKKASRVFVMRRDDFLNLIEQHPAAGAKILKGIARVLSNNLRKTSREMTELMMPLV